MVSHPTRQPYVDALELGRRCGHDEKYDPPHPGARSLFGKAVAGVRIVVDPVLTLELLDVRELALRMRARNAVTVGLVGVKEDFLHAAAQAHPLVFGEIEQERRQSLLESQRNVDAFDPELWARSEQTMAEAEVVAVKIVHAIIA